MLESSGCSAWSEPSDEGEINMSSSSSSDFADVLISEVCKRRALWDVRQKTYHNRHITEVQWKEVANVVGSTSKYLYLLLYKYGIGGLYNYYMLLKLVLMLMLVCKFRKV